MAEECAFAEEYDGPPISYEIPRAIPIEIDHIPIVQPLPTPDLMKRVSNEIFQTVSPKSVISERPDLDGSGEMGSSSSGATDQSTIESGYGFASSSVDVHRGSLISSSDQFVHEERGDGSVCSSSKRFSNEFFQMGSPKSVISERPDLDGTGEMGSSSSGAPDQSTAESGYGFASSSLDVHQGESRASFHQERGDGSVQKLKKGACYRCQKGNRFTEKEACLVCDSKYCISCLVKAMGSMPEGRKCISCIGFPVDDRKRENLGKCSRMLKKLLSPLEIEQVLKAERFCEANRLRADHVFVNGCQISQEEMILLQSVPNPPNKIKPGRYWYDKVSGFWGKEGHKPLKIITAHLNVGGSLMTDASNGMTGVFINNREITKPELRMLQFAGVQCAGSPHFWLNADGSYQEEGQKNIRGNLWEKTGMKLLCSVLSLPTPSKETVVSGEEVNNMHKRHLPDYFQPNKLLLIGYSKSGTSTIFKQAKILYQQVPFSDGERETIKLIIQTNIYKYLGILLEGRQRFEEESLREINGNQAQQSSGTESGGSELGTSYMIGRRLKDFSDWLLKVIDSGSLEVIFPAATREYAPVVEELWKDPAIQATYRRRNELQLLPSSSSYFLERVIDISRAEYEPSQLDILHADGITSSNGLTFADFVFPHLPASSSEFDGDDHHDALVRYQLIRVNARGLGDHYKWLEMFEDVRLVIFCVALTDYDEHAEECSDGPPQNKMLESKRLFESIVSHPTMEHVDFLLVLTKLDLLDEKLARSPLTACDWFRDYNPFVSHHRQISNSRAGHVSHSASPSLMAFHYIASKFKRLFHSLTDGRKLYVTSGNGLEPESTDRALRYAREVLRWEDERLLYTVAANDDVDTYSTDHGSPLQ